MKKLILLLFLFTACGGRTIIPLVNYKGSIVVEKRKLWRTEQYYYVSIQGEASIIEVSTSEYDYERYKLGDTIK